MHHSNGSSDSKNGVCSTVAMQLLLGYHNYYTHRGIIPFSKSDGTPFLASDFGTILKHPYLEGNINYDNDYLGSSALGTEPGFFDEIKDLTFGGELLVQMVPLVKEAAMEFIDLYSSEEVKDDITMNFSAFSNDVARAEINAGRPLLLCYKGIEFENDPTTDEDNEKSYHVVVAYGYATYNGEQGFIVHMGYKNDETQVWVPASWFGWQLTMSVNHTHTMIDAQDNHAYAYREIHCTSCGFKDLDEIYNTDSTGTIITGVNYSLTSSSLLENNASPTTYEPVILTIPKQMHFKDIVGIGNGAFSNQGVTISVDNIEFQSGSAVTSIGNNAFAGLGIKSVNLANIQITDIGNGAFANCSNLTTFNSTTTLETIGANAFQGCNALTTFIITNNVRSIGIGAFNGCNELNIFHWGVNDYYLAENNILYDKNKTTIIASGKVDNVVSIPNSVGVVKEYAFYGNTNLTGIIFNTQPTIESYAFGNCSNLESVYCDNSNAPYMQSFAFPQQEFTVYCPFNKQDVFSSAFSAYTDNIDSRQLIISYVSDGAILDTDTVYYGSSFVGLVHSKLGYDFVGWYDANVDGNLFENGELIYTYTNLTLYARWSEPLVYLAYYNCDKGTNTNLTSYTVETENLELLPPTNVDTGYTFSHWTADGESITTLGFPSSRQMTITAVFTANTYTIRLIQDRDNPSSYTTDTVIFGQNYTLNVPYKEGYDFDGWEYLDTTTSTYCNITDSEGISYNAWCFDEMNKCLYARWVVKQYALIFRDNNDVPLWLFVESGVPALSTEERFINYGTEFDKTALINKLNEKSVGLRVGLYIDNIYFISLDIPVNGGGFDGVQNAPDNSLTIKIPDLGASRLSLSSCVHDSSLDSQDSNTYSLRNATNNDDDIVYFSANYSKEQYNIKLNKFNGTTEAYSVFYNDELNLPSINATGHTFVSWTNINDVPIYSPWGVEDLTPGEARVFTSNEYYELYENQQVNTYQVRYFDYNNAPIGYDEYDFGQVVTLMSVPTRVGYNIVGWCLKGTETIINSIATMPANHVELVASYDAIIYTVKIKVDGQSDLVYQLPYDSEFPTIPNPTKQGYTFIGWENSVTGVITEELPLKVTATATFTAKFDNFDVPSATGSVLTIGANQEGIDAAYLSCSSVFSSNAQEVEIIVQPSLRYLTIVGSTLKTYTNKKITIESGGDDFTLILQNVKFTSNNAPCITSSRNLYIVTKGSNNVIKSTGNTFILGTIAVHSEKRLTISGSTKISIYGSSTNGTAGGIGVFASNLDVYCSNVIVYGGNGEDGSDGINGVAGIKGADRGTGGGDGENGANGTNGYSGTSGFSGGIALLTNNLTIYAGGKLTLYGGDGGNGGDGGDGGNGGDGGRGGDGTVFKKVGDGGNGGNGGNAGSGGTGGAAGVAIAAIGTLTIINNGTLIENNGSAGVNGANGTPGQGGIGGQGGTKWNGNGTGANGSNGSNGMVV